MDTTPRLKLPYILQSQAQKEVTHNEALEILDVLIQVSVIEAGLNDPPKMMQEGDSYIIGSNPRNAWQGRKHELTTYRKSCWHFVTPFKGFIVFVSKSEQLCVFDGKQWQLLGIDPKKQFMADEGSSPSFNHKGADVQLKINKKAPADKATILFGSDQGSQAEIGTIGNNNLLFKVAAGANLIEALKILQDTGRVTLKSNAYSLQAGKEAYQITKQTNEFVNVAEGGSATLPVPETGDYVFIANASSNALSIYVQKNHYINNSDKPYLLAAGKSNIFWAATHNKWYVV